MEQKLEEIKTATDLANVIRTVRKRQGISQTVLAQLSNVGVRFVFDVENGKPTVQFGKVLSLLRTMGVAMKFELPSE